MDNLLWTLKETDVTEIENDKLLLYRRALQKAVGGHLQAYKVERVRLADVEKEIEGR